MNKSAILICVINGVALGVYGYLRWASVLKVKQSGTSMVLTIYAGRSRGGGPWRVSVNVAKAIRFSGAIKEGEVIGKAYGLK